MGYLADRQAPWQRERQVTDALEALALVIWAIAGSAGVSLAGLEPRTPSASATVLRLGSDQRWRGTSARVGVVLVV